MVVAKTLRIHGKVQGVFFRESMRKEANRLGVVGWVRNRSDRTVEAWIQGEAEAVKSLDQWANKGPPNAAVNSIDREDQEPNPLLKSFERLADD